MLKLKPDPTFIAAVKIPTPSGEIQIKVKFKHMSKDAFVAFVAKERQAETMRPDKDVIMDIAEGWEGVDAEFNSENVAELCQQYHRAGSAIVETYIDQLTQFRRGNS